MCSSSKSKFLFLFFKDSEGPPEIILTGSGSEVSLALDGAKKLVEKGVCAYTP